MRRVVPLLAVLALAGVAPPAPAAAAPRLSATPDPVRFGEVVTVSGRGWPVIEFCARRVRLVLRSAQNELGLGFARVRASGRFRFEWTPRRSEVGAGAWRVVARLRCESGDDGSPVFMRRSVSLRIR
ncbi:MAG TPA: hypothetical protein VN213_00490 [Solirubrobacteraceae bacterium]|nr:hypothetical protein [Solirubrobacteraceae bacterium]